MEQVYGMHQKRPFAYIEKLLGEFLAEPVSLSPRHDYYGFFHILWSMD
jgi:hypothetical protein